MKTVSLVKLLFSIAVCLGAGLAGSFSTVHAIPDWYATLTKPSFSPPNWVFGPVWTLLYVMMGIAAYIVWSKGLKYPAVRKALIFFLVQLALNAVWSFLFFGLRSPLYGLVDIFILWVMILVTIGLFSRISTIAAALLIPYLFWVTFASGLNLGIFLLNR